MKPNHGLQPNAAQSDHTAIVADLEVVGVGAQSNRASG
jgi:hypothetical protein